MLVKEIFSSMQGEGPDVGTPAVFVRLAGCNLACAWCDTDYVTDVIEMSERDIGSAVRDLLPPNRFVVLTGGEPFLQPLATLMRVLVGLRCAVQIETNGTLWQPELASLLPPWRRRHTIVCSPKPGHTVHQEIFCRVAAFKYVVGFGDNPLGGFLGGSEIPIFVQPRDDKDVEKNKANLRTCVGLCMARGWRLSLQTHKLLGLR